MHLSLKTSGNLIVQALATWKSLLTLSNCSLLAICWKTPWIYLLLQPTVATVLLSFIKLFYFTKLMYILTIDWVLHTPNAVQYLFFSCFCTFLEDFDAKIMKNEAIRANFFLIPKRWSSEKCWSSTLKNWGIYRQSPTFSLVTKTHFS